VQSWNSGGRLTARDGLSFPLPARQALSESGVGDVNSSFCPHGKHTRELPIKLA
jgi:hypothetical protein